MINYPIGIQTFEKIRSGDFLYVDKTKYIYELAHRYQYVFLSRPRRFGKSLLVSTFESYFRGKKDLFNGLAIADLETEWFEYPVLHFSLDTAKLGTVEDLRCQIKHQLRRMERGYGMPEGGENISERFQSLVEDLYETRGKRVVVLIDEYDSPMLNVLHDKDRLEQMRTEMQGFYSPLKALDP